MWNSRPPIRSESKRRHLFNKKNHRFDCKVNEIKENQSSCGFDFVSIRRFPGFLESRHPFVGWSSLFSFIFGKKKTMRNTRSHSVALIISESPICDKEICNQPTQCWFCWSLKHQTLFMMALVLFFFKFNYKGTRSQFNKNEVFFGKEWFMMLTNSNFFFAKKTQ